MLNNVRASLEATHSSSRVRARCDCLKLCQQMPGFPQSPGAPSELPHPEGSGLGNTAGKLGKKIRRVQREASDRRETTRKYQAGRRDQGPFSVWGSHLHATAPPAGTMHPKKSGASEFRRFYVMLRQEQNNHIRHHTGPTLSIQKPQSKAQPATSATGSPASSSSCSPFWSLRTMPVKSRLRVSVSRSIWSFWTPSMNSSRDSSPGMEKNGFTG